MGDTWIFQKTYLKNKVGVVRYSVSIVGIQNQFIWKIDIKDGRK